MALMLGFLLAAGILPLSGLPRAHAESLDVPSRAVAGDYWAGSWATSFGSAPKVPQSPDWAQQTLRMVVNPHLGGEKVRLKFSNTFSPKPVRLGHVTVAPQKAGAEAASPPVSLTFAGKREVVIPAGGEILSDTVTASVTAEKNLLVSVYLPDPVTYAPVHSYALTTSYTSSRLAGDRTTDIGGSAYPGTFSFWTLLSGIDVATTADIGTVVALGDSQTDGAHSTKDQNRRWPDIYAAALNRTSPTSGVVNAGISGNRLLIDRSDQSGPSALSRLERDVFGQTNVRTVVVYEGINDIALDNASSAAVQDALTQIARKAKARGIRVIMATIPAFDGYPSYTDVKENVRQQVNSFIRKSAEFDGVVDFDLATRDPDVPNQLSSATYNAGDDHLHFNDNGSRILAETLLRGGREVSVKMSQTSGGDVNGDGVGDLLAREDASGELKLWKGGKGGSFSSPVKVTGGWRGFSQNAIADITGDAKADLIGRDSSGNLKLWAGRGDGTFLSPVQVTGGWDFTQTAAADVDGDGKVDLIARGEGGNLNLWKGRGNGTFGVAVKLTGGWEFTQTVAADFNGDKQADIIARDGAGILKLWTHNPAGHFNAPVQVTGGWDFTQTTASDFDGDGKADLIARNDGTGELRMWRGKGNGTFGSPVVLTSGW
ncbi:FG-GAP-like repeat-containing protein [Streptomyces sp. NPDC087440]|uniref:FG-GAP-like repeat-containing protein n=1 Tax=Streptomyces sp. NPDC087440 TaxID=3365790 RepID=UPI0038064677